MSQFYLVVSLAILVKWPSVLFTDQAQLWDAESQEPLAETMRLNAIHAVMKQVCHYNRAKRRSEFRCRREAACESTNPVHRQRCHRTQSKRNGVVVRFRFADKGVRMAHNGDPIIDRKGKVIGVVTSCAIDTEGYLTGQGFIDLKSCEEGASIYIYQGAPKSTGKSPAELTLGDRMTLPSIAVIISRFPK